MASQTLKNLESKHSNGEAIRLLLLAGSLIGLNFPLGKLAVMAGVPPLLWAGVVSFGVLTLLLPVNLYKHLTRQGSQKTNALQVAKYTLISAPISFVAPNLLIYSIMPHLGAGYVGLMFALSPVFTLLFSACLGMKTPGWLGVLGIVIGLAGAIIVNVTQGLQINGPSMIWLVLAVGIPIALATGNIVRSVYWPVDVAPSLLAFSAHSFCCCIYLVMTLVQYHRIPYEYLLPVAHIALAQMMISGVTFNFVYRLQRIGGPILLSQMGYVAAAVGLGTATIFLNESYNTMTWLGALVIGIGIITTIKAQASTN